MANSSFVFYESFLAAASALDDASCAAVVRAICDYGIYGKEPDSDGVVKAMFLMAKPVIDKNNQRRENGRKGGEASATSKQTGSKAVATTQQDDSEDEAMVEDTTPISLYDEDEDVDVDEDEERDVDEDGDVDITPHAPLEKGRLTEKQLREEFEEIWKLYPRKIGKPKSFDYYKRDRRAGASPGDILNGVSRYVAYLKATGTEDKYIRMGSTFFNQRNWQDAWEPPRTSTEKAWEEDEAWASQVTTFF